MQPRAEVPGSHGAGMKPEEGLPEGTAPSSQRRNGRTSRAMNSDPRTALGTHSSLVGATPFPILFSRRQSASRSCLQHDFQLGISVREEPRIEAVTQGKTIRRDCAAPLKHSRAQLCPSFPGRNQPCEHFVSTPIALAATSTRPRIRFRSE